MKQQAAPPSRAIVIITAAVLILNAGLYAAAFFRPSWLVAAVGISVIALGCHLFWTPVAYEMTEGTLTVIFRASRKRFGPVTACSPVEEPFPRATIRLWGDSGFFAISGIFWNKRYGVFRAYVTRARQSEWLLVETARQKIFISPADPAGWRKGCPEL